jgi:hypothetical protein
MYESGEQQPVLAVAVRLAGALGVTVNELAGLPSERVQLDSTWWPPGRRSTKAKS